MHKNTINPQNPNPLHKDTNYFETQREQVFNTLYFEPHTARMVAYFTGVPIGNVKRYISEAKKRGLISKIGREVCAVSKRTAQYYMATNSKITYPLKA